MSNNNILIAEDDDLTALYIKETLEKEGYAVSDIVVSGEDAIARAVASRPDLVLMDIVLRGKIDGIDAAEKIYPLLSIPVVYLTAHADKRTLQRAKMSAPFGYVVKPFVERDLHIAIEFALYKARIEAEKDHLVHRLQDALAKTRTLSGTIPICASCKKVRDDKGFWHHIESYITNHSEAKFTHSLCTECARKMVS